MAHAQRYTDWQAQSHTRQNEGSSQNEDWNNLRDELENLLDQVHMHQHDISKPPSNYPSSINSQHIPYQSSAPTTQNRHQEALISVQRAVERFSEPEEASPMPAQSQHQLQNAIRQIRSSQRGGAPRGRQASYNQDMYAHPPRATQADPRSNQFEGFSNTLGDISSRLEQFETALGNQQNSNTSIADMAMQIEQLSGVVEHLANNIGERGQIKRLETQIAKMADALPNGSDLDFNALNNRLDVLSGAFEQLRDLQAQQVELNIKSSPDGSHMKAIEGGVRNIYERLDVMEQGQVNLEPIETCVRSIYDRIDTLEKSMAMPSLNIDKLSRDMADFTKSMRETNGSEASDNLLQQVDGLVSRIEQIELEGSPVGDLKADMAELHATVVGAMEPRFAALEGQIGKLSAQISEQPKADKAPSVSTEVLEKHLQALAKKLDHTSSELSGLKQVFGETRTETSAPDFNAMAEVVAQRTSDAMQKVQKQSSNGIEQKALDQLENRLSGLFTKHSDEQNSEQKAQQNLQEFVGVQNSINQVNQRLARLEKTLNAQDHETGEPVKPEAPSRQSPQKPNAERSAIRQGERQTETLGRNASRRARHPGLADEGHNEPNSSSEAWEPSKHLIPELADNMPRPPAQAGPLNAPAFGRADPSHGNVPVPASLRVDPNDLHVSESEVHEIDEPHPARHAPVSSARASTQKPSPTLPEDATDSQSQGRIKIPDFDKASVTPPPAPSSAFSSAPAPTMAETEAHISSTRAADSKKIRPQQKAVPASGAPQPSETGQVSRSTFIEAARRAAQAKNSEPPTDAGSQSLIGRAMARFQKKKAGDQNPEQDKHSYPNEMDMERPTLPGDADHSYSTSPESPAITRAPDGLSSDEMDLDDLTTVPESFLTRHRQPILLAATVVAVGLLTVNLINQRFSGDSSIPSTEGIVVNSAVMDTSDVALPNDGSTNDPAAMESNSDFPDNSATGNPDNTQNNPEIGQDTPVSINETTGSIDRFSGVEGSDVRVIDPTTALDMPPSLNMASLNAPQAGSSALGMQLPPEAIGPLLLRQTAADGDARAQFEVAAIYAEGRALTQDLAAAAIWYERAAAQGYAPASYRLANMFENGIGVEKDLLRARLWYQLAADAGNRMSMHNLASLLASGQLGAQEFESAAHWFESAAALGLKDSQFNLGMLHARGLGVPQNLEDSFKWFSIAAKLGDEDAAKARDDIARSLDAQIVADMQSEITAWEPAQMNIRANFAPIGTWAESFDPGPTINNREVIIQVQAALNGLGFDTGTPDGLIGPKTIEAISGFETQTGMAPSGEVNPRLLAVLGSQPV